MAETKAQNAQGNNHASGKQEDASAPNEIRVGQRRSEAYVKIAEGLFLEHDEIILCGLGNTIRTVVSVGEILKHRKYATVKKIDTSMVGTEGKASVAKLNLVMKRNPGIKELLQKIAEENKNESELERHLREQEEKEADHMENL